MLRLLGLGRSRVLMVFRKRRASQSGLLVIVRCLACFQDRSQACTSSLDMGVSENWGVPSFAALIIRILPFGVLY